MENRAKVLFIVGPTAAGKTDISLEVAKRLGGEVVSADSMQIYDELSIGTARPAAESLQGIPHHLFGFLPPDSEYSVAKYQSDALSVIENILSRSKLPIVVGGTGLYINSLVYDIDFTKTAPDYKLRDTLSKQYDEEGADTLYKSLIAIDPDSANRIHKNDKKRLIRRLEILLHKDTPEYAFRVPQERYALIFVGINKARETLYQDIEKRVDLMMAKGLEAEVRNIYEKYGADITAFSAIGYKEFLPYFKGEMDIDSVIKTIKRNTRRFAKRQLTWFRREENVKWFFADDSSDNQTVIEAILLYLDGFFPCNLRR